MIIIHNAEKKSLGGTRMANYHVLCKRETRLKGKDVCQHPNS